MFLLVFSINPHVDSRLDPTSSKSSRCPRIRSSPGCVTSILLILLACLGDRGIATHHRINFISGSSFITEPECIDPGEAADIPGSWARGGQTGTLPVPFDLVCCAGSCTPDGCAVGDAVRARAEAAPERLQRDCRSWKPSPITPLFAPSMLASPTGS